MNKQTRVTPIGPKQENKNPMNVEAEGTNTDAGHRGV